MEKTELNDEVEIDLSELFKLFKKNILYLGVKDEPITFPDRTDCTYFSVIVFRLAGGTAGTGFHGEP